MPAVNMSEKLKKSLLGRKCRAHRFVQEHLALEGRGRSSHAMNAFIVPDQVHGYKDSWQDFYGTSVMTENAT